jgi:hypothetical protein
MNATALAPHELPAHDRALGAELLAHLDAQIASASNLLAVVLDQGAAIRVRDVTAVVRLAGILRGEIGHRQLLEEERSQLLARSASRLGVAVQTVTLGLICTLLDSSSAERAYALSARLRGLLGELQREHSANRALMQLELGFLDHLMGILALDGVSGYDTRGSSTSVIQPRPHGALHVLDLRA